MSKASDDLPEQTGNDHQAVARDVDVDIFQIVDTRTADRNPVVSHSSSTLQRILGNSETTMIAFAR